MLGSSDAFDLDLFKVLQRYQWSDGKFSQPAKEVYEANTVQVWDSNTSQFNSVKIQKVAFFSCVESK